MSNDTQVKQEAPERVFLKACHPFSPNQNCTWSVSKEPKDSVEYVRADLLATVRKEAFKEVVKIVDDAGDKWGDQALARRSKTYSAYVIAALDLKGRIEAALEASANSEKGEGNGSKES